jgi:hypothetical protein
MCISFGMNTASKLGPHTHEPRDVPRFGGLSLLQTPLHNRDFRGIRSQSLSSRPWPSCYPRPRFCSRDYPGGRARQSATSGYSDEYAELKVYEHRAGEVLAARGLLVSTQQASSGPTHSGPRDVPRCGALSLLQKPLQYRGVRRICAQPFCSGHCPSFYPRE